MGDGWGRWMVLGVWRLLCLCAPSRDQRIVWHGLGRNSGDCMDCSATSIYTSFIYSSFKAKCKAVVPYLKGRKDASIKIHGRKPGKHSRDHS